MCLSHNIRLLDLLRIAGVLHNIIPMIKPDRFRFGQTFQNSHFHLSPFAFQLLGKVTLKYLISKRTQFSFVSSIFLVLLHRRIYVVQCCPVLVIDVVDALVQVANVLFSFSWCTCRRSTMTFILPKNTYIWRPKK